MELYNCEGLSGKQRAGVMHMETISKDYMNPMLIIAEEVLVYVLAKALLGQPLQALHKMCWVLLPFVLESHLLLMGTAN